MPLATTYMSGGVSIGAEVFDATGPVQGVVVVAYGTEGLNGRFGTLIRDFCNDLALAGFQTSLPFYFESTRTVPGMVTVAQDLVRSATWVQALVDAVAWAKSRTSGNVGMVGFSLGANQMIHTAIATPVQAVVDFFGPISQFGHIPFPSSVALTQAAVANLPATQIHHGSLDKIVLPSESKLLDGWLRHHGISCDWRKDYPCGHPGQPEFEWTAAAQQSATSETITFLKNNL